MSTSFCPMAPVHITAHAVSRFQERVRNLPEAEVITILDCPAVHAAVRIRAPYVRLASGHRIVIAFEPDAAKVVTVLPRDCWINTLSLEAHRRRKA